MVISRGHLHSDLMCRDAYTKQPYKADELEAELQKDNKSKLELTPENIQALINSEDLVPVRR